MKTLICSCNGTSPIDAPALAAALDRVPGASSAGLQTLHSNLCRREAASFQRAAQATGAAAEPLLVACTQEARLFLELNYATTGSAPVSVRPIRFVNLRESAGWSRQARQSTPKLAALIAAAQRPDADPVTTVAYRSEGRVLVIGPAGLAHEAAARLAEGLQPTLLIDPEAGAGPAHGDRGQPQDRQWPVHAGRLTRLQGWLGAFEAGWSQDNPIDLDLCTRCNACITACPEGAIDFRYQVDASVCRSHRACVQACEAVGAIDFNREPVLGQGRFDAVLDLRAVAAFSQHQPPQGYVHVPPSAGADRQLAQALRTLAGLVGEFEKPRFFNYTERLCAHSRNQQVGCSACIDVCSTGAISSQALLKGKVPAQRRAGAGGPAMAALPVAQGGGILVEPHLCAGCGACSTVCPSGALQFAYPSAADTGARLRTMLQAYAAAGGRLGSPPAGRAGERGGGQAPALLLHSQGEGQRLLMALGRAASVDRQRQGLPARVLPVPVWHTASIGLELWLSAVAQGASQVWVLLTAEEAPEYRQTLAAQMAVGEALLQGLGYEGTHFALIEAGDAGDAKALAALDAALQAGPAVGVARSAGFGAQTAKRDTLAMAIDHLVLQAPAAVPDAIALPASGSPLGSLKVDTDRCTLCLSCVGACPAGALGDNPERPQLKFTESACVQCGLCVSTCPESAITLEPRLLLADEGRARKATRVLHEQQPFACIRCKKPFGTLKGIETMVAKLAGHSAFQGAAADRLKMCGDCRVIDIHSGPNQVRIQDL